MTAALAQLADECCDGRMVVVTEGGYDLPALGACLDATVEVLAAAATATPAAPAAPTPRVSGPGVRGREAAEAALAVQRPFWPLPI